MTASREHSAITRLLQREALAGDAAGGDRLTETRSRFSLPPHA
jgi:hypothetical protein